MFGHSWRNRLHDMPDSANVGSRDPARIFAALLQHPACKLLRELTTEGSCHLVGGALRDAFLGARSRDLDVVVAAGGRSLAQGLAARLACRSIALGGDRFAAYRVAAVGFQVDIWDRGEVGLEADLRRRDFSIHSFALDLSSGELIDPFRGLEDLAAGLLRMTTDESFAGDPLRVMRLCRFAAQLAGFGVDSATAEMARRSARALSDVASERIRTELMLTLACDRAAVGIDLGVQLGVFPDALLDLETADPTRTELRQELKIHLARLAAFAARAPLAVDWPSSRLAVTLAVSERLGVTQAETVAHRLRTRGWIAKALAHRLERLLSAGDLPRSTSGQRWWLHQLGQLWCSGVCVAAALATPGESAETAESLFNTILGLAIEHPEEIFDPPRLLSGDDLTTLLGIGPGAEMGRILTRVRRRQIEGSVGDRRQALRLAARLIAERLDE